jgi:hypothetical protein
MKKSDLTPAETKAALDGFKLHDELCCRIEECEQNDSGKEVSYGYSGQDVPYRQYHITSYGMPERSFSGMPHGRMSFADGRMDYSGRPQYGVHGWYQNNDYPMDGMRSYRNGVQYEGSYYGNNYSDRNRGYSRHSIGDRVVEMVENMMDSTNSEYERQELQKYIRTIRAMMMSE